MLLEEYLSPTCWNLPTTNQSEDEFQVEKSPDWTVISANEKPSTLSQLNNNILLVTLLLEGIGNFAKVRTCNVLSMVGVDNKNYQKVLLCKCKNDLLKGNILTDPEGACPAYAPPAWGLNSSILVVLPTFLCIFPNLKMLI